MAITYLEAIREAQARALKEHDNVYIYGQDVSEFGGAFKATKGLSEMFPGRVLDSPISEDAMIGSAVGAAIEGMRPIIEMQFADFSSIAFNQIVNQAATQFYRTGVSCPITVRLPSGGTEGSGGAGQEGSRGTPTPRQRGGDRGGPGSALGTATSGGQAEGQISETWKRS